MRFDSWKLGYKIVGYTITAHYPHKSKDDGIVRYAMAGFPFNPRAEVIRSPESERAQLWSQMCSASLNS